ncbi:hypothetical protein [Zavarzinella formosa]|uniref:hypothetical protein n=1 Tax=Zavarzinella formosa TaxID=360055 RepID=UPI00031200A2|nr:hypothetical protein [Zavarzinella formosa]
MLRLTLRTLLAYLDDTLDPAQAKDMGRRVAESDFAQETVERIKNVTRRRRLAAPAVDQEDSRADANTIAEYLDNSLPSEQIAELEAAALKHDVLLAEVAASHQILTLVLGEPAKVPPTARQRMYGLVKGPEALPNRKPSAVVPPIAGVAPPPTEVVPVMDEDLIGTLRGSRKFLWAGGFVAILAALVVAVWMAIPAPPEPGHGQGYVAFATAPNPVVSLPKMPDAKPGVVDPKIPNGTEPKMPPVAVAPLPEPRVVMDVIMPPMPKDVSAERKAIGLYDTPTQPLLVRKADSTKWELVKPDDGRLFSTDTFMALPGFHPSVKLDNGTQFELWGNIPEFLNVPALESRVTFYLPPEGFDADLTLHAGRVFIRAPADKKDVKIRVRFLEEIWNIVLTEAGTEIAIDRLGEPAKSPIFDPVILESPRSLVYLGVIKGEASAQVGLANSGPLAAGSKFKWDSKGGRADIAPANDPDEAALSDRWSVRIPGTPAAKDIEKAIEEWKRRAAVSKGMLDADFDAVLRDSKEPVSHRALAAWYLQATDNIPVLLDSLELDSSPVRDAVVRAARHWCAQSPDREKAFAIFLAEKKTYPDDQRTLVQALLRSRDDAAPGTTDQLFRLLRHERLAIRELARFQLAQLDPLSAEEAGYEAAAEATRRADQIVNWQKKFMRK